MWFPTVQKVRNKMHALQDTLAAIAMSNSRNIALNNKIIEELNAENGVMRLEVNDAWAMADKITAVIGAAPKKD